MSEKLIKKLKTAEDERSREYELALTKIALSKDQDKTKGKLLDLLENSEDETIRYNAFYCINILLRREKDFLQLHNIFEKYGSLFQHHETYNHLRSLFLIESDSFYDYDVLLRDTFADAKTFSNNAGFVHLFADTFATIYEKEGVENLREFLDKWHQAALEQVNHAIELDSSYAKYYCTRARIRLINREFSQAENDVNNAIALENSKRHDYYLRISNYQYYKLMIQFEKKLNRIQNSAMANSERKDLLTEPKKSVGEKVKLPAPYSGEKPYIFISYAHDDKEQVFHLLALLSKHRIRFWYDKGLKAGDDYMETIGEKIRDCSAFVFLVSSNSVKSNFVRKEIQLVGEIYNKKIFCYFLEDTQLSPRMLLQFSRKQYILSHEIGEKDAIQQLIHVLPHDVTK